MSMSSRVPGTLEQSDDQTTDEDVVVNDDDLHRFYRCCLERFEPRRAPANYTHLRAPFCPDVAPKRKRLDRAILPAVEAYDNIHLT
jgi:hypothetical protein